MQKQALSLLSEYQWVFNKGEKEVEQITKKSRLSAPKKAYRSTVRTFRF